MAATGAAASATCENAAASIFAMHRRPMGRAHGHLAAGAVLPLARRGTDRSGTGLDAELDAVWFSHRQELTLVAGLLARLPRLSAAQRQRVCETMERVGSAVGLHGPWRILELPDGRVRLSYCSWWDERMPAAANEYRWHVFQDEYDGGLIDELPEPRYLGREVVLLAQAAGHQAWRPGALGARRLPVA